MFACMAVCTYVCTYVNMYVTTYVLIVGYFYVDIFSGFFTASVGQSQFIDIDGDMCLSQSLSVFFFCHSWLLQSPVCFQPQLGTCVCVCVCLWVCVLTVHAQCTYSARTVHGPSARARNAANTTENCPKVSKQRKNRFQDIFNWFHAISTMTCYLHHFLRVHSGVHCGVHCACTVRALSKHTHSACRICMHACLHVWMHACLYVCMYVCIYFVCLYVCMYVCMYVYVCLSVCLSVCMYVCMYVCKFIYVLSENVLK